MTSSHTPGPWNIYKPAGNSRLRVYSDRYDIADTSHAGSEDAERANAALIAAAPDMLRLLIDAEDALRVVCCRIRIERIEAQERGEHSYVLGSQHAGLVETWTEIKAAIARVTGSPL